MKSFLISDNRDTWLGLRLAGIDGIIVNEKSEVVKQFRSSLANKEIGILILTENIVDMLGDEVVEIKLKSKTPLIIEIPDRHGSKRKANSMAVNIKKSVGIKI